MNHCSSCKTQINKGDIFCEKCGVRVVPFSMEFTSEPTINLEKGLSSESQNIENIETQTEKPFYEDTAFIIIAIILATVAIVSIFN